MAKKDNFNKVQYLLEDPIVRLLLTGSIIVYGGKKILESLGLKDTKEEQQAEKDFKETSEKLDYNVFSEKFLKTTPKTAKVLNAASNKALAKKIYNAIGYIYDDEDEIFAAFKSLKSKADVSALAYWYNHVYGKDLYSHLKANLNDKEMKKINDIVLAMPNYRYS